MALKLVRHLIFGVARLLAFIFLVFAFVERSFSTEISEDQWREVVALKGISAVDGLISSSIYVFFDPNCPMSAESLEAKIGGRLFGEVEAIWIPVHYMSRDSLAKSAALLRSGRFSSVVKNFSSFDFSKRSGSIESVVPSQEELRALGNANEIWQGLTATPGTPMIVYKDRAGGFHVHLGYRQSHLLEDILRNAPISRMRNYHADAVR